MSRRVLYGAALLPQLLLLGCLIASEEWSLRHGVRVLLEIGPWDQSAPGGYRSERGLAIAWLRRDLAGGKELDLERGDLIYVLLETEGEVHRAAGISGQRPDPTFWPFLRGRVGSVNEDELEVEYGFSDHYVGKTRGLGDSASSTRLAVRIGRNGAGHVEDLLVDGQPYDEWRRQQEEQRK
ncbi:MAG: hypothetical protein HY812_13545 [Planctomycetes bacterium]|nr:hypothetical protein [Planctomycetota bacterium]